MRGALCALALVAGLAACQPGEAPADARGCAGDGCAQTVDRPAPAPSSPRADVASRSAFDYWILALSWSPEYCASPAARPGSRQCAQPREFIVHGLWPQYERGWPEDCRTRQRPFVPQSLIDSVRIMGGGSWDVAARVVVNATGIFTDSIVIRSG